MREIQFRGKRVDNDEWVYGWYSEDYGYAEILTKYNDCEVILETVGQYTGLRDRNASKIYEGDVLRNVNHPDNFLFEVRWNEYYGSWFLGPALNEVEIDHFYQSIAKDCEVIGNIHDNPELIGKKK